MRPCFHDNETPSLVLTGELDGGRIPLPNYLLAGELPYAEFGVLDGLKHSILMEAPNRVAAPLKRFRFKHR